MDISEFLYKSNIKNLIKDSKNIRVAYHPACSLQHGQNIVEAPKLLLKYAGYSILNFPDSHICCGSAGTYNILQSDIAEKLLKQKVENINKVKPDFISTGNIGCIMQITNGTNIPILHTVEVIDWYTGGPKPEVLKRL